jgi:hypothetical protein
LFLMAGCGPGHDSTSQPGFVFAALVSDDCAFRDDSTHGLPPDADRIVVRLLNPDGTVAIERTVNRDEFEAGAGVLVPGLVPGEYDIEAVACQGDRATWWGQAGPLHVDADSKTVARIFLAANEALSCIGGDNRNPRVPAFDGQAFREKGRAAFGAMATTADGRVFLAGGGDAKPKTGLSVDLDGTSAIWEWDGRSGLFREVEVGGSLLTLNQGRLGHALVPVGSQTLLAIGGAGAVELPPRFFPGADPPILPLGEGLLAVDIIDLSGVTAAPAVATEVRADLWPAVGAVASPDGRRTVAFLAGGWNPGTGPVDRLIRVVATISSDGGATDKVAIAVSEGQLPSPRFGASALVLPEGDLLLVGGWNGESAGEPLWIDEDGTSSRVLAGLLPHGIPPTAFPSLALLDDDGQALRVLVLGGNPLGDRPVVWRNPGTLGASGWILTIDRNGGVLDPSSARGEVLAGVALPDERSMASLVPLSDPAGRRDRLLLVGGYRSFLHLEDGDCGRGDAGASAVCFPAGLQSFGVQGLTLVSGSSWVDSGRLGAAALPLRDGRVLAMGGLSGLGGNDPREWLQSSGVVVFSGGDAVHALCRE